MGELETRVAECVKEYAENGFWRTCSGCHETEDGHDVGHYPFNKAFDCKLGSGCSECGGIGAVWDTTDYLDMAHQISCSPGSIAAPEPNWTSAAEREAVKAGQSAAFAYSETGGGPVGIFLAGLRAYRIAISPPASPEAHPPGSSVPATVAPGIRLFIASATHSAVGTLTPVDQVYQAYCQFCATENLPRALAITFTTLMEAHFTIDRFRYQRRFVNLALNEGGQ